MHRILSVLVVDSLLGWFPALAQMPDGSASRAAMDRIALLHRQRTIGRLCRHAAAGRRVA